MINPEMFVSEEAFISFHFGYICPTVAAERFK
jgi:hypothetical protein